MPGTSSVVKKLSLAVIVIVAMVIAAAGLVNSVISRHYALESARAALRFNSESILSSISKLMMTRNNDGVLELIEDISRGSTVYRDIRLVSHYSGEVVVSRLDAKGAILSEEDPSCAICHDQVEPIAAEDAPLDQVRAGPDGGRFLHVITPIMNEPGCETGECHEHAESGPILGFLEADYSLGGMDSLIQGLNTSFAVAALAAILLGALTLWAIFKQALARPIQYMLAGLRAIGGDDLSFRFQTDRRDEFGLVAQSFDHMAARIQAQQTELRDAREYLEGIVENSADMIITVNPEGRIQTVNRGAEQALGYDREELIGERIELLFADPHERDVAIARLNDQDNVANYETRFLTKQKEVRHVLLTLSRLRDREGNPIGTFGISKDITKEKELQDLLVQSQAAAAIGQAATAIQHAIKNMLNTLTGGSYLARHGMKKNDRQVMEEGIGMIDEGVSSIADLSLNILKYAKQWILEPEVMDLALLVEDICKSIGQTATDRGVKVCHTVPDRLPLVSCDSRLLHMALMDVATNALDACVAKSYNGGESPEIAFSVSLENAEELIAIEVRDNGIGMSEETRASIFTPFFSTKADEGTGLGLALTSRIVKLHGGAIEVESQPGRGSAFRIILPVRGKKTSQGARDGQEGRSHR